MINDDFNPTSMADDVLSEETESVKFLSMHLDRGLTWLSPRNKKKS